MATWCFVAPGNLQYSVQYTVLVGVGQLWVSRTETGLRHIERRPDAGPGAAKENAAQVVCDHAAVYRDGQQNEEECRAGVRAVVLGFVE